MTEAGTLAGTFGCSTLTLVPPLGPVPELLSSGRLPVANGFGTTTPLLVIEAGTFPTFDPEPPFPLLALLPPLLPEPADADCPFGRLFPFPRLDVMGSPPPTTPPFALPDDCVEVGDACPCPLLPPPCPVFPCPWLEDELGGGDAGGVVEG